jgi:energy-converting hydrogenase Eha subunit H
MTSAMFLFMGLRRAEVLTLVLILFGITLWALIDTVKSDFKKDINNVVWIIVILSIPLFGGILYYLIGRGQKTPV